MTRLVDHTNLDYVTVPILLLYIYTNKIKSISLDFFHPTQLRNGLLNEALNGSQKSRLCNCTN